MDKQFAIIGCGKISRRHAAEISKIGNLKAVCDIAPERADALASAYGATPYYSLAQMLGAEAQLEVLSVCTPNGLHAAHTIEALRAGLHVVCEKPLCLRSTDGLAMIREAAVREKKLFVVKSTRYNPAVIAIKRLFEEELLGEVFSFQLNCVWNRPHAYYEESWRGSLALDGGTLFTQFSHYIDVLLWLLGEEKSICGFRRNANHLQSIEFEDAGAIAVQMNSGAIGTIHYSVNAASKNQEVSLTIVAANATIKLAGEYMNEIAYQQPVLIDPQELSTGNPPNNYGFYTGSMSNHDQVYKNIFLALSGEKSSVTDGAEALKTVQFIEKIYQQIHL